MNLLKNIRFLFLLLFFALVLKKWLDLGEDEIASSITDGSDDYGVDAIHIDSSDSERPTVYMVQSKYFLTEKCIEVTFPGNETQKLWTALENLILHPSIEPEGINEFLKDKLIDIRNLPVNPKIVLVFCSNSKPPASSAQEHLEELKRTKLGGRDLVEFRYLHLAEISELFAPSKKRQINTSIRLLGDYLTFDRGGVRTLIGRTDGISISELLEKEKEEIFDMNIRGFLQTNRRGSINSKIFKSATTDDSNFFFFLNNGITMICKKYDYLYNESPIVKLTDVQIVNGGQTARAIAQAKKQSLLRDIQILVRIVETSDDDLVRKIIEATNSQNLITNRDLRSNDEIQKKIEERLLVRGYYYEARKDKYRYERDIPASKRLDASVMAQTYFSYALARPADAKNKKRYLFGEYYPDIFNETIDLDKFLLSYLLFKKINSINKNYKDLEGYSFVNDAAQTILASFRFSQISLDNFEDNDLFEKEYKKIIEVIKKIVLYAKERDEKYSHRAFFVRPDTFELVVKQLG